ncbi:MAG: Smr/MutS family protein, partial [Pseudomonadota bacterium]|nr:Smr/MutS family protein [Pseudomonadota bacterium]
MKKNNKKISSSDLKLWNQILDKVEPIKKSGRSKVINQKESVIEDNIIISGDLSEQNTVKKRVKRNKIINVDLPNTISNNNSDKKAEFTGIHRRLEQKMSRGQIKIDSTLDLHGMNQEEAKDATINFVRMAKKNNLNIVLIITGKGISKDNTNDGYPTTFTRGVLNQNLP